MLAPHANPPSSTKLPGRKGSAAASEDRPPRPPRARTASSREDVSRPAARRESHGKSFIQAAPPRNPSPAPQFSSLRRSISSPSRRPGQPSNFGQGKSSHRDPSPAEERPGAKASISAREASSSGGSSASKGRRGAGATAVGDAGFRQSNVKVALRCRPLSGRERDTGEVEVVDVQEQTVSVVTGGTHVSADGSTHDGTHVFAFDYAFGPEADQVSLFAACGAPLVEQLFEGFNATCFAYGQTGSGKTHTMMGTEAEPGLTPRVCWFLFDRMAALAATAARQQATRKFRTSVTYLQIYNEALYDMLADEGSGAPVELLRIRHDPQRGVFVQGLKEHVVTTPQEVRDLLNRGNHARATSATKMNASSSRSHAVFTLHLQQERWTPLEPLTLTTDPEVVNADPEPNPDH